MEEHIYPRKKEKFGLTTNLNYNYQRQTDQTYKETLKILMQSLSIIFHNIHIPIQNTVFLR